MKIQDEPRLSLKRPERPVAEYPVLDRERIHTPDTGMVETKYWESLPKNNEASSGMTARSSNIPIPNRLMRTESETRLDEQEQLAEIRDCIMFTRLVNGITQHQTKITNDELRSQNDLCLAHIVATRFLSKEDLEQLHTVNPNDAAVNSRLPFQCNCPIGRMHQNELQNFIVMSQENEEHDDYTEMFDMDL